MVKLIVPGVLTEKNHRASEVKIIMPPSISFILILKYQEIR